MKEFETIGKKMPYQESSEYLNQLIERTTETAIRQSQRPKDVMRPLLRYVAAAAVVALFVFVGFSLWSPTMEQQVAQSEMSSPVDDFLNNISDEDVQLLAYYDIDDIPEYE